MRDRFRLAVRNEDRVEAEAFAAARVIRDAAAERPRPEKLLAARRQRDQLADVARVPTLAFDSSQLPQEPADLVAGRTTRRVQSGTAVECRDLESRILAKHPPLRIAHAASELRLRARVLVVRRALFGWELRRIEDIDRPAWEQPL